MFSSGSGVDQSRKRLGLVAMHSGAHRRIQPFVPHKGSLSTQRETLRGALRRRRAARAPRGRAPGSPPRRAVAAPSRYAPLTPRLTAGASAKRSSSSGVAGPRCAPDAAAMPQQRKLLVHARRPRRSGVASSARESVRGVPRGRLSCELVAFRSTRMCGKPHTGARTRERHGLSTNWSICRLVFRMGVNTRSS
jgi:hypothetical protein